MSMELDFKPHSWLMEFAIKKTPQMGPGAKNHWEAFIENGNTYRIDQVEAATLYDLKMNIHVYHVIRGTGYGERYLAKLNEDTARNQAIDWQRWAGEQSLSYGELSEWQRYFEILGKKFDLLDEFRENGIV